MRAACGQPKGGGCSSSASSAMLGFRACLRNPQTAELSYGLLLAAGPPSHYAAGGGPQLPTFRWLEGLDTGMRGGPCKCRAAPLILGRYPPPRPGRSAFAISTVSRSRSLFAPLAHAAPLLLFPYSIAKGVSCDTIFRPPGLASPSASPSLASALHPYRRLSLASSPFQPSLPAHDVLIPKARQEDRGARRAD